MALPAWQTGELDEEWVESSPSPPTVSTPLPTDTLRKQSAESISAKRGSLRALGHSAPRALPPSRSGSASSPRIVSGHGEGRVLSEKYDETNIPADLPSPPESRSSSGDAGLPAGTFVVKEGVDDDRGAHLAKKGKDMFGPTALEKMFRPPSPPPPSSSSSQLPAHDQVRRASHPYAPANPSSLSKSVTPSTASGSTPDPSMALDETQMSLGISLPVPSEVSQSESSLILDAHGLDAHRHEREDANNNDNNNFLGQMGDYPFTFEAPHRSMSGTPSSFDSAEPTHSTLHQVPAGSSSTPGLRLFRSTYDTYTREHLSAVVDSIAIEASPSPEGSDSASLRWSPTKSPSFSSPSDRSGSQGSLSSEETRSSKRMRMSPTSPLVAAAPGVRDWGAQAAALMNRIRAAEVSAASASPSASDSRSQSASRSVSRSLSPERPDVSPIPPVVSNTNGPSDPNRPTHRSYPSTTSSGYLRRAEELMARIKARTISESASNADQSPGGTGSSRFPSGTSSEWDMGALVKQARQKSSGPSPRRLLRRLSASEEIKRVEDYSSGEDAPARASAKQRLDERWPASSQTAEPAFNTEDLNRFVSATTVATATTMSTSFIKHPGPRHKGQSNIQMIKPDDVADIVPDRVGKMRFDKNTMRWVRDGLGRVEEEGENRSSRSRSDESEDVFAGMDSWGSREASRSPVVEPEQERHDEGVDVLSESSDSELDDETALHQADITRIIDEGESDISSAVEGSRDASPQLLPSHSPQVLLPVPPHASSVPPVIMTPTQNIAMPLPIRSALRNANSVTPGPAKRTQWHESVTPAPASNSKRSVSFSDGKKNGKIRGLHNDDHDHTASADEDWFQSRDGPSWLPSARTKRVENMLEGVAELSLDDGTPSKVPAARSLVDSPDANEPVDTVGPDETVRPDIAPVPSFRERADANATFLTECSFGVSHDKLVQLITDVYGSEPYWDQLTLLDLRNKGADSVARLKEFLPDLEEVNLDDNKVSYLSGIPSGVRSLQIARNRLTSMTSVDHLRNLQYLDVSGNQLDSVTQLNCLKHLRELRLDNNAIGSLDGIMQLDGLIKLSAKGNKITALNLAGAKWARLEVLDVTDNRIGKVTDLDKLASLQDFSLENNQVLDLTPLQPMACMRTIRISGNLLSSIDLALFPKLRTLYADRNDLHTLKRTAGTSRIENLSLRNQLQAGLHVPAAELQSVKRLYLSGNPLSDAFFPTTPLYALSYLEAAACNLRTLPREMARTMPSLKILNVNYNYFENLDGLLGMKSLRKVSVVGARLGGSGGKAVMRGLKDLSALEEVDLRMNPSTLNFYFPLMVVAKSNKGETPPNLESAAKQNPLPSVTLANIRPLDTSVRIPEPDYKGAEWARLDAQFRRSMPDEWYGKRLVYRGLVMGSCTSLRVLDGVKISEGERRKAGMLIEAAATAEL